MKTCCALTVMDRELEPPMMAGFTYEELVDIRHFMEEQCIENLLVYLRFNI